MEPRGEKEVAHSPFWVHSAPHSSLLGSTEEPKDLQMLFSGLRKLGFLFASSRGTHLLPKEEKEKRKSRQSGDLVCRRRTEVSRDQPAVCSSLVPPGRGVSPREAPEPPCPAVRHTSSAAARQGYRVSVFVLGRVRLFAAPWTAARQAPPSMGFSRQEHCAGCHFLFQGILPTQGSNPGLPSDSLPSEPPGKP